MAYALKITILQIGLIEEPRRGSKRTRIKDTTEFVREKSSRRHGTQQIEDETILLSDVKCEPGEFIDFEDPLEDPLLQNENEHKEYGAICKYVLCIIDTNGTKIYRVIDI